MRVARVAKLVAVLAVLGVVATASLSMAAGSRGSRVPRLQRFTSCSSFLGYVKSQAGRLVGPSGLPGTGPAVLSAGAEARAGVPGVDYSTTNVQEMGVDEPDIVKTDGKRIVALVRGKLYLISVSREELSLAGSLPLAESPLALFLVGDRALVISQEIAVRPLPGEVRSMPTAAGRTVLTEVDLRSSSPQVVQTLSLDGAYLGARLVGSSVRLVLTSSPTINFEPPKTPGPEAERAARTRNRAVVASSRARDWLPSYALENRRTGLKRNGLLLSCRDVGRPQRFSGLAMLTVVTLDLEKGILPVDTDGVLTDGQTVYASKESLYVATQRWVDPSALATAPPTSPTTTLHKFDIGKPLQTRYRASGEVAGYVQNQFSLSDDRGVLRVVTTELPAWWGSAQTETETVVTTLEERGGKLVRLGRVSGLGRGERTYGVRFIGDVGTWLPSGRSIRST